MQIKSEVNFTVYDISETSQGMVRLEMQSNQRKPVEFVVEGQEELKELIRCLSFFEEEE